MLTSYTKRLSLAAKISALVLAMSFISACFMLGSALEATRSILKQQVEFELGAGIEHAASLVEHWFLARELEILALRRDPHLTRATAPGEALHQLAAGSPDFNSLMLVDARGQVTARGGVSTAFQPADEKPAGSKTGGVIETPAGLAQIFWASLPSEENGERGWIGGLVLLDRLEEFLRTEHADNGGSLSLVDASGRILMGTAGGTTPEADALGERPKELEKGAESGEAPRVYKWRNPQGREMLGVAVRIPRIAWTLAVEKASSPVFAPVSSVFWRLALFHLLVAAVGCAIAVRFVRSLVAPLQALSAAAHAIAQGDITPAISVPRADREISTLVDAFNQMADRLKTNRRELRKGREKVEAAKARLRARNEELHRSAEQMEQLSITDGLTQLYNHRHFHEHLGREISAARRTGTGLSLILVDLDDFKKLNDRYGHAAGDMILNRAARVMAEAVRENDLLARYGGEEFALVSSQSSLEGAARVAEKLRLAVSGADYRYETDEEGLVEVSVTISVGVAMFRSDTQTLFNDADKALYEAKSAGKDCVMLSQPD